MAIPTPVDINNPLTAARNALTANAAVVAPTAVPVRCARSNLSEAEATSEAVLSPVMAPDNRPTTILELAKTSTAPCIALPSLITDPVRFVVWAMNETNGNPC